MSKSVTFGVDEVYAIEDISYYTRLQTLPGVLDECVTELKTIIDSFPSFEKLSVRDRRLLIMRKLKPMADKIVHNRDVLSLTIHVKGEKGELAFEDEQNRTIIMVDFVNILLAAFRYHKTSNVEYSSDKSMLEFNVDPFPVVELNIENLEINDEVLS